MDDDLTFNASVWAESTPVEIASTSKGTSSPSLEYETPDDFDDFGPPDESDKEAIEDDDFGDFGDFGEANADESLVLEDVNFEQLPLPGPSNWRPLQLDPFPSRSSLENEINETLVPIWQYENISDVTTDEQIREAEGIAQILLTPDSREMYKMLLQTPPPTKPPNWIRSRIRRQHLIALGIPVNLDEVLPRAASKPLPMLEIHTRPMSAPPDHHSSYSNGGGPNANHQSRAGTPKPGAQAAHFGPKPVLDMARINKSLQLNAESLTMQPLANLERYLEDIRLQTADTSSLLTHLLQARDSLQLDSEMYNGLIAEMVGEAQKLKSGKPPRTASIRRGTGHV